MKLGARDSGPVTNVRTFLIADVRGYTRFTREHGDASAARLAKKFAELARDSVEARGGRVIELRGDEALAVFTSTPQAVRAALEFQATCLEETAGDPALPLTVGIGIDVGEAIPVEEGFRGVALNTAARLCSKAVAGEVLVTRPVAELAGEVEEVRFEERGAAELKGFEGAVELIAALPVPRPAILPATAPEREAVTVGWDTTLPPELDSITPLVDREHEMHWLRGTWRLARRGRGRVVFVSGPSQIGKTRLAAEIASEIGRGGGRVHYAGPGGAAAALAIAAVRAATDAVEPTLVVLDDLDVAGEDAARALAEAQDRLRSAPVLAIGLVKDPEAGPALAAIIDEADRFGDGHVPLSALDLDGVEGIARLYVGGEVQDVPLESMARASGGVPGRVHEVASEWARDEAGRRLTAAAEWLAEGRGRRSADLEFANNVIGLKLGRLYSGEGQGAADSECPYKGLASFEEADAAYFFGRERLVGELAARTVQFGLLGVVGASGSGKSSVVAAGLLPSLRAGLLPGSERWRHVMFRPGEHPMAELAAAVARGGPASADGGSLDAALDTVGPEGRLVVAVDQFEEVFTLCTDRDEQADFIEAITRAAMRWPERIVIVLTIRDDFYGRCAPYRELAELVTGNHVLVSPMTRDELRRAIELPARRAGLRVESALGDTLVAEVAEEPGGLPLLSSTLVELWQARAQGWLRMDAYELTGGVRGAVARLAEASYQQLTDAEREVARRMFLRLSGIGEGDVVTRRRVQISEFDVDTDSVAADVLARLTQDRLLTMSDSTVEVAHEALLREWPRLRTWLEEDVQGHQLRQHLTQAAKQWQATGRDASEVYRGARLSTALDWASTRGPDLNEIESDFLTESRQASEREAERQRRTSRRLRGLLVGTAVFLVVALVAGGLALVQRGHARQEAGRAERQARIASARELAAAAVANLDVDPERSILLALEAVDATREADGTILPEAEEVLHLAVKRLRVIRTVPQGGDGLSVTSDGTRFLTTGLDEPDGTTTVWELETGERLLVLPEHGVGRPTATFSPDGRLIATGHNDATVRIWDASTGEELNVLRGHEGEVWHPAFSPDGRWLATGGEDATVRIWDVAAGTLEKTLTGHTDLTTSAAFSPDGARLASASFDATVRIWDTSTWKTAVMLKGHERGVYRVVFSAEGSRVATAGNEGTAILWDAESGARLETFFSPSPVDAVAFSPDGTRIATAGSDAVARVWEAKTGREVLTLAGHTVGLGSVAFTPDGNRLLTAGLDGTTRLWDLSVAGARDWLTVPGAQAIATSVAFSPDGRWFAAPAEPAGVTIWDTESGAEVRTLVGHDEKLGSVSWSPDGGRLAASSDRTQTPPVWDVRTGELLLRLVGHDSTVRAVAFSPDGRRLVTGSYDKTARVWDSITGKEQATLESSGYPLTVGFSPDGRFIVTGDDRGVIGVWDAVTMEQVRTLSGHRGGVEGIAFGSNGLLFTASTDGTAKVWDLESGEERMTLRGQGAFLSQVAVSPDGTKVATTSDDKTTKLWDLATGRELFTMFGNEIIIGVDFSPDGRLLATASPDGTVALHLLPIDEFRELARERVTRTLTDEECRQYLHAGNCPAGI